MYERVDDTEADLSMMELFLLDVVEREVGEMDVVEVRRRSLRLWERKEDHEARLPPTRVLDFRFTPGETVLLGLPGGRG